ncbi:Trihelix transcription factor GT-2 [Acipenser ruthenus]|uniref:Trihelix transcription factor GT-2 n=1 Tax=Acipenser ruthenus TaxID=7906 RepID=A0A444UFC4_ACIRT|nr:Trihelix transcription factor GT-2 [Acipenser ruthenus]
MCHSVCFHHRPAFEEEAKKNHYKMDCNDFEGRKMQAWDADEVQALVTLWCDRSVQGELASSVRNEKIYAKLAADLKELGYNRSLKQCQEKIKKLKQEYKKIKEHNSKSGADHKKGKYYDIVDSVLGHRPAALRAGAVNSATEIMEAMVDPPAEKGKKRKRVDAPAPVLELVQAMRESDTKYMDFMQVQMQAERDFRERQMALDPEQRERQREASTTLNTQLISVLGRTGEALLTRNAKDIPVD